MSVSDLHFRCGEPFTNNNHTLNLFLFSCNLRQLLITTHPSPQNTSQQHVLIENLLCSYAIETLLIYVDETFLFLETS
ncbi:hypothetical protein ACOSQ3_031456 [Xanthoceras sorbifolium]